jgi:hypothetical protein
MSIEAATFSDEKAKENARRPTDLGVSPGRLTAVKEALER